MENSINSKVLEVGLKKALIFGLTLILFFIIGMALYNLRALIINLI